MCFHECARVSVVTLLRPIQVALLVHQVLARATAVDSDRFGHVHPGAIRFAKFIGHLAARRQALRDNEAAAAHDPTGVAERGAASAVTSQTLARVSIALQRSNAMTLRTYLTDCVHHTNKSVPVPFGYRRRWQRPVKAGVAGGAGEGGAVLGDLGEVV